MEWQGWFSLTLTIGALGVLTFTRISPHLVMMTVLTILSALGVLSVSEALAGFSNSGLITVAAMFVIAAGIHSSGGIDLLVKKVLGQPTSVRSALGRIFAPVIVLSAFMNNTPVVATMIPAIHAWSRKIRIPPSKLMIPLSYTAILGGTLTLIGTSTNLVVNGQYQALTGEAGFSLFSITAVGAPVAAAGLVFIWLFLPKWLPDRSDKQAFANLREFTLEVTVDMHGPLVGKTVAQAGLRNLERVYLVEVERLGTIVTAVPSEEILHGGDRLVFAGDTQAISDLLRINGIIASPENGHSGTLNKDRAERRLVEAVVSPHCAALGRNIRDAKFRDRYGAVVLAVARNGERVKGNLGTIRLKAGDTLLLEARPAFVTRQRHNKDFLLINDLDAETPRHERAWLSWAILVGVVAAAGFGFISMLNAALIGAGLMIITGCCSVSQAEKSLDLTVIITIAAAFALGAALQKTGVAQFIASSIIELSSGIPWLMLVLTYVAVSLLTETITNNAAAVLMLPIVLEMSEKAGLNNEPFVFAIMMAASASFATPLGYQTNLMVYGPGGYRFSDFLKVGLPMNVFIGAVTVSVLIIGWPLTQS
ncbi:SLC13 family permease [Marinobacter sp. M3C]|jgi:di/tricarboxylate transporter|uniref:SLC13 family permease n=2 Tax=unclassified Marinobacter TaxID=83889 RepID=UPI00200C7BDB|nr:MULTISPECIES: SLC13 family permease [unclassified Marinobacter]MCL1476823.1 SLC13 family permease [Marinobacter sp.]MCL1479922.1 SLC13 family permease [Marinobacter sp.]UQG61478.1 SLC13 family permease [Marinobacter sp. M3C]UQG66152.1 SLC13 family permease [Marinobacter sp. M2C]